MCQAYEGERAYMARCEKSMRKKGYDAMKAGVARDDNPEPDHELPEYSHKRQWWDGWDTANAGKEPW